MHSAIPFQPVSGPARLYVPKWPPTGTVNDYLLQTDESDAAFKYNATTYANYLDRFEMKDLELDGNFAGQGALTTTANSAGYRSFGVSVWAKTGLIRNCVLRNFGSVGEVPQSIAESSTAGIETFPLRFGTDCRVPAGQPERQFLTDADRWIVEDSKVLDYNSIHGGYATMILGTALLPAQVSAYDLPPAGIIRRCLVSGDRIPIGLGMSGSHGKSGRIRFNDNVVLNSRVGFNSDTSVMGGLELKRNFILDSGAFMKVGSAKVSSGAQMQFYDIQDNFIRIRGRTQVPVYRDYLNDGTSIAYPDLPLGRMYVYDCYGVGLQGLVQNHKYIGNRFTTWPLGQFLEAGLPTAAAEEYRPFWVVPGPPPNPPVIPTVNTYLAPPAIQLNEEFPQAIRYPSWDVTFSNNSVSTVPYDFFPSSPALPAATFTLASKLEVTSAPEHTGLRAPLPLNSTPNELGSFLPRGKIRGVNRLYSSGSVAPSGSDSVSAVEEVQIGEPTFNGSTLNVPVRAAKHLAAGSSSPGSALLSSRTVGLRVFINGATTPSEYSISGTSVIKTFAIPSIPTHARILLEAWMEEAGKPAVFDRDQVAWSSLETTRGTVVNLSASPDVADDKNLTASKRARFVIRRTGTAAVNVDFLIPSSGITSPVSGKNLIATYGSASPNDYSLVAVSPATFIVPPVQGSIVNRLFIPAGLSEAQVEVVPVADNLTESSVARIQLAPSADYALGSDPSEDLLIYDGPEWTIVELTDSRSAGGQLQSPTATYATSIGSGVPIRVGGRVVYTAQGGAPAVDIGGYWNGGGNIIDLWGVRSIGGLGPAPRGISDVNTNVANKSGRTVGESASPSAFMFLPGSSTPTWIGNGWNLGGGALGISPNANRIVGWGLLDRGGYGTFRRPLVWRETNTSGVFMAPSDLAANLIEVVPMRYGDAFAVNTLGHIVGQVTTFYSNQFLPRGFLSRTESTGASTPLEEPLDVLLPSNSGSTVQTVGAGISSPLIVTGSGNGYVVGSQVDNGLSEGAFWFPRAQSAQNDGQLSPATALGRWEDPISHVADTQSAAAGINSSQMIVGWSSSLTGKRAVVRRNKDGLWLNLNDKHLVYGLGSPPPVGWNLQEATAVNEEGSIVGNGTKGTSSTPRGFLLIRRLYEN